jgi:hypothetical protein
MLVWARFALSVQTSSKAHKAYYAMGTKSYPEVKWLEEKALNTHLLTPKLRNVGSITVPPLVTAQAFHGVFFTVIDYRSDVNL